MVSDPAADPPASTRPEPATETRGRRVWRGVAAAAVAAALVHPVARLFGRSSWLADLIGHFQEPAFVVTLLAAAVVVLTRSRRLALGLLLLGAFQAVPLVRYSGSNPVAAAPGSRLKLRILYANVLHTNGRHDDLARLIRVERPDVIGLVEYSTEWQAELAGVRRDYPYGVDFPADAAGLALWFREQPLSLNPPVQPVPGRFPFLHATFEFAGRVRHLWLVHPTSPMSRFGLAGNPEVAAIAENVRAVGGSRVVVGDMNSTDGSAHFRDFLNVTGLRDSRLGFGRQGSWPANLPYRIAIDHALVSPDLAVVARRLGPDIGSDHLPVIVDLAPAAATKPATNSDQSATSVP